MRKLLTMSAIGVATLMAAARAQADDLAIFTFETSQPTGTGTANGSYAAEGGVNATFSFASGAHASSATAWSHPSGNGSVESFSSNNWGVGDYYQFTTGTLDFEDIVIRWDQTRSSTGPASFKLQYSADGDTFTDAGSYTVPAVNWSSTTADATGTTSFSQNLSTVTSLEDDPSVFFRLVATSAAGGTAGSNRVDNVRISAAPIPEPASLGLLGLSALALRRRRRGI